MKTVMMFFSIGSMCTLALAASPNPRLVNQLAQAKQLIDAINGQVPRRPNLPNPPPSKEVTALGVALADLRAARTFGHHVDPSRCSLPAASLPPVCVVNPQTCSPADLRQCNLTCHNEPPVCGPDPTTCHPQTPAHCEQSCVTLPDVCEVRCSRGQGCRRECHTPPPVCSDDPTRCTPQGPIVCDNKCVPGQRLCNISCPQGYTPACQQTCTAPVPVGQTPDCTARNPIPTRFDAAAYLSPEVGRSLKQKADEYRDYVGRHFIDGQLITAEVDLSLAESPNGFRKIVRYHDYQNASGTTGTYVAALAFRYGVTHDPADLARLRAALLGLHAVMTIAATPPINDTMAPNGVFVNFKKPGCDYVRHEIISGAHCSADGQGDGNIVTSRNPPVSDGRERFRPPFPVPPRQISPACIEPTRRGVWVRSFGPGWSDTDVRPEAANDLWNGSTYGFSGHVPGFPGTRFRIQTDQSKDNVDMIVFGITAAYEVLSAEHKESELLRNIGYAFGEFMDELISSNYQGIDWNGAALERLNVQAVQDPNSKMFDLDAAIEALGWLRACHVMVPDQRISARCGAEYAKMAAASTIAPAVFTLARQIIPHREVLQAVGIPNNFRPNLYFSASYPLFTFENDPTLLSMYRSFFKEVYYPLVSFRRVPLLDSMYLSALRLPDAPTDGFEIDTLSLRSRITGVLNQVPRPIDLFAVPQGALPSCAVVKKRYQTCSDPHFCSMVNFSGCRELQNDFPSRLAAIVGRYIPNSDSFSIDLEATPSIWALGPAWLPQREMHTKDYAYRLAPEHLCDDDTKGGTLEPGGLDYLVAYWFAKYHSLLP